MSGIRAGQHAFVRPWHVFVFGSTLGLVALFERVQGFRSGRQYVLCHESPALNHFTLVALALVAGAFLAAVVGAATATVRSRPSRPPLLFACMVAALALVVAADRVDADGERRAAKLTAERQSACDYTPQVYSATPGWFSW
ncbi:hypothetical protein BKI49_26545 [Streptomyces sp. Tue6028]|uniref:hypothetical protein n=1 Tax=Streptomyces sp. Tue6028 TaxID=2036037 RepID=UPI000BDD9B81|nr:hypothetical protein [Streptomyces sp. Tue6028]PBC60903.1 hypothetical protein BKI49_26545 [Streptomyces sp. Tue6028]